jgi:hypothetical protein
VSPPDGPVGDDSAKNFCAAEGRDGFLAGMKTHATLDDRRGPLDPADDSADVNAGRPIQATRSATTQHALTALARLLARQAAAEAVRATLSATPSPETEPAK